MIYIKIEPFENGAHDNQENGFSVVPKGWAIIPENMECKNFPFGEVEAAEIDGVMTVTKWTPGTLPQPEPAIPAQQREGAYNTEKIIMWEGEMLTVTEAAQLWQYYAAEGNAKANTLTDLIAHAKATIREKYPDKE